jgi:hypothetical protein
MASGYAAVKSAGHGSRMMSAPPEPEHDASEQLRGFLDGPHARPLQAATPTVPKQNVAGSNPVSRSITLEAEGLVD